MKNKITILVLCLALLAVSGLRAQNTFRVSYQIAVPSGETQDFIEMTAFRGIAFEYYNQVSPGIHMGLEAGWNFFHKEYERQTYQTDFGAVNMKQWRYKHVVPVTFNTLIEAYRADRITFYWKYGLGAYWVNDEIWAGISTIRDNSVRFGMVPGVGFTIGRGGLAGVNFATEYQFIVQGQMVEDGRAHSHYWNFKMGLSFSRFYD
jgi:hypothetical protein